MKTTIKTFSYLIVFSLFITVNSCSTEEVGEDDMSTEFQEGSMQQLRSPQLETTQDQIDRLTKKMRRYHNFQVAQAQGYTVLVGPPPTMYVPNMGYHYLNPSKLNGEFNLLEPEILVYHKDEDGNMIFGAVEYLVEIPGLVPPSCIDSGDVPVPDSFIGDQDEWEVNCGAGGYTLHAWVGLENPMGVFHNTNPLVPETDPTLD